MRVGQDVHCIDNCGLLTTQRGIPTAVSVFEGNTGDPKTLLPQVEKIATLRLPDGSRAHSFRTLLDHLGEIVQNTCRSIDAGPDSPTFDMVTSPNTTQLQALELLRRIEM